jgi:hypothetical protein
MVRRVNIRAPTKVPITSAVSCRDKLSLYEPSNVRTTIPNDQSNQDHKSLGKTACDKSVQGLYSTSGGYNMNKDVRVVPPPPPTNPRSVTPKNQNRTEEVWNTFTPPSTLSFVGPSFIAAEQPHPGQAAREAAKSSPQSGQVI